MRAERMVGKMVRRGKRLVLEGRGRSPKGVREMVERKRNERNENPSSTRIIQYSKRSRRGMYRGPLMCVRLLPVLITLVRVSIFSASLFTHRYIPLPQPNNMINIEPGIEYRR